jgi:hypothetical protein
MPCCADTSPARVSRLGRHIDQLADIGRKLWFDPIHALINDDTCAGCHDESPVGTEHSVSAAWSSQSPVFGRVFGR